MFNKELKKRVASLERFVGMPDKKVEKILLQMAANMGATLVDSINQLHGRIDVLGDLLEKKADKRITKK